MSVPHEQDARGASRGDSGCPRTAPQCIADVTAGVCPLCGHGDPFTDPSVAGVEPRITADIAADLAASLEVRR